MEYSFVVFVLITTSGFVEAHVHEWGYHYGVHPDKWGTLFPTCDGQKQSPIDIKTNDVICDRSLDTFDLKSLRRTKRVKMTLENVGHAVQVDLSGKKLRVKHGSLPGTYIIEQFHFHWGSADMRGSEHEINGKHFSMEMHIVMYSSKFSSVKDAMNTTNGLAVLGCLVDVGEHNKKFDEIISHMKKITHKDDKVNLKSFSILGLLPKSTNNYYRYYGSLTTPACYESVIWSILTEHTYISEGQLNTFRALGKTHFKGSENLINNYRNPQPLNGRIVRTNDQKFCKDHNGDNGHHGDNWEHDKTRYQSSESDSSDSDSDSGSSDSDSGSSNSDSGSSNKDSGSSHSESDSSNSGSSESDSGSSNSDTSRTSSDNDISYSDPENSNSDYGSSSSDSGSLHPDSGSSYSDSEFESFFD